MTAADPPVVVEGLLAHGSGAGPVVVIDDRGVAHRVSGDVGDLRAGTPLRLVVGDGADRPLLDVVLARPRTPETIERFLASGFFPGIGVDLAARLVARFGVATLEVIESCPPRLTEVDGIGPARASRLAELWAEHRHLQDVAAMLRGHGVGAAMVTRMIRRHGGDVMWLPTPAPLIDAMLDLARVTADDHVIDLGAGDGALVLAAARRGARAHGVEANPELVAAARRRAAERGLDQRATFAEGDLFAAPLDAATVVTLFLLPGINRALQPRLLALAPGTRVVSNTWGIGDWAPEATVTLDDDALPWRTALLWTVPPR